MEVSRKEYIQTHIDEAIEKGWICVYIQPVVRVMTGKICGGEALSRWIDPVYGMISPGEFVPALEEKSLSYKLALFVIDHVARHIREYMDAGLQNVPVSVNFSRRDFENIDPYEEVEKAVLTYGIPRSTICVEITESMAMEHPALIQEAIGKFHRAGYEVWMDDFGSAYSSLNSLKDFDFDEIKLDMVFLRNLNDKSKEIIASCIQMARHLHIHTLCEGVETKEQLEFLRDVGCDKVQGFYYSKPQDPDVLQSYLEKRGMEFERPGEKYLYDAGGIAPFGLYSSWALVEWNGNDRYHLIFCSKKLRAAAKKRGFADLKDGKFLNPDQSGYAKRICMLIRHTVESGREEELGYFSVGHFFSLSAKVVTSNRGIYLCAVKIRDTTEESRQLLLARSDGITQSLVGLYSAIYLIDRKRNEVQVITSEATSEHTGEILEMRKGDFLSERVFWKDTGRYHSWITETLSQEKPDVGLFRFENSNKTYEWKAVTIIPYALKEEGYGDHLVCVRVCPDMDEQGMMTTKYAFPSHLVSDKVKSRKDDESWWKMDEKTRMLYLRGSIRDQDVLKIFWKGRDRRFFAASKAFLKYYGLSSEDDILGKTDEDLGWNGNVSDFRDAENRVLEGEVIPYEHGTTIVNGEVRNIVATKFPIVHNGRIIGLAGCFFDADEIEALVSEGKKYTDLDENTGCMRFESWCTSVFQMENDYLQDGDGYAIAAAVIQEYVPVQEEYGTKSAEQMASVVAKTLKEYLGEHALIARTDKRTFLIAERSEQKDDLSENDWACTKMKKSLAEVQQKLSREIWLGQYHTRVTLSTGVACRSEFESVVEAGEEALVRAERRHR